MKQHVMLSNIFKPFQKANFKVLILMLCFSLSAWTMHAQDVLANVEVTANRIQGVEQSLFQELEGKLNDFINNRKWTTDNLQANERIQCQFNLVITAKQGENTFTGTLSIQAQRPVYNSNYTSPIFAIQDSEVFFKFENASVLQFNEQNVSGADPILDNLTAIFAYYVYMIIGFDYDSFALNGGEAYFKKAENIVLNAPKANGISGWDSDRGGRRNRHALVTQILSPRYKEIRPLWYEYHRKGLDEMLINPEGAVATVLESVPTLKELARANTGSYLMQWYFTTKSDEWVHFLSKADAEQKKALVQDFVQMDVSNANKYRRVR